MGHPLHVTAERVLDWKSSQIDQVTTGGDDLLPGDLTEVVGRKCLRGSRFNFRVRNDFAFDVDETIQLDAEFHLDRSEANVEVSYDGNNESPAILTAHIPALTKDKYEYTQRFSLERARLAHRGSLGSDFSIGIPFMDASKGQEIILCNLSLSRSYQTKVPQAYGTLVIEVRDETGRLTPARVGLYDAAGRDPLPSDAAVPIKKFNDTVRTLTLRQGAVPWPMKNRSVFYIDGTYRARVPQGKYNLVIAKGPEYRILHRVITVGKKNFRTHKFLLRRWNNLAGKGWYSGEDHVHYARGNAVEDRNLLLFTQAEDLHVANILQMGNIVNTHFLQYDWKPVSSELDSGYWIVPGQEDPRTGRLGHTLHLNLGNFVHPGAKDYLSYEAVFEQTRALGAVVGYAHLNGAFDPLNAQGLALDAPLNLIDFAEILQTDTGDTGIWFDFLNLGFKLSPSAGTDYPYVDIPGAIRNYVKVAGPLTPQGWFDGLKRGATFVTNGPMLEFNVNGQGMGSEIRVKAGEALVIEASATLNPEIDNLDRLELIEQGKVVDTVRTVAGAESSHLRLRYRAPAMHGSWFVVSAYGKKQEKHASTLAFSGAIYVNVDGQGFWSPTAVPSIVARRKNDLQRMLVPQDELALPEVDMEAQKPALEYWESQKAHLQQRVEQASAFYDELAKRALAVNRRNGLEQVQ